MWHITLKECDVIWFDTFCWDVIRKFDSKLNSESNKMDIPQNVFELEKNVFALILFFGLAWLNEGQK